MSLIACKNCGENVSDLAEICPHCGKKNKGNIKMYSETIYNLFKDENKMEIKTANYDCDNKTETLSSNADILDGFTIKDTRLINYFGNKESVIIPPFVKSISAQAFAGNKIIKEVIIPESVTLIGSLAFANCSALSYIKAENENAVIGEGAFDRTAWYNSQDDGLLYYGNTLYSVKGKCESNIEIKNETISISPFAFYGQKGIKSVTIPESVQIINTGAFMDCISLKKINFIGNKLKYIYDMAFENCNITFHCLADSYAHKYALQHNIDFSIYNPKI